MHRSPSDKDTQHSDTAGSSDSIGDRSSRDVPGSIAPDLSSLTDMGSSVQRTAADSAAGPQSTGPDTRGQYEQRYGVDIDTPGQADRLQRLEESNTLETVQRWADEGMPVEAMGTPSKMEAFREQKDTPVSSTTEPQNDVSNRTNTSAIQRLQDTPAHVQRMQPGEGTSRDWDQLPDTPLPGGRRPRSPPMQEDLAERLRGYAEQGRAILEQWQALPEQQRQEEEEEALLAQQQAALLDQLAALSLQPFYEESRRKNELLEQEMQAKHVQDL